MQHAVFFSDPQHESIGAFPSEYVYSGLMVPGRDDQSKPSSLKIWPSGKNKPLAFVHVVGSERRCTARTSNCATVSLSNPEQTMAAVSEEKMRWNSHKISLIRF